MKSIINVLLGIVLIIVLLTGFWAVLFVLKRIVLSVLYLAFVVFLVAALINLIRKKR